MGAICAGNCAEQLAATFECSTASAVGEEAEVADADSTVVTPSELKTYVERALDAVYKGTA